MLRNFYTTFLPANIFTLINLLFYTSKHSLPTFKIWGIYIFPTTVGVANATPTIVVGAIGTSRGRGRGGRERQERERKG